MNKKRILFYVSLTVILLLSAVIYYNSGPKTNSLTVEKKDIENSNGLESLTGNTARITGYDVVSLSSPPLEIERVKNFLSNYGRFKKERCGFWVEKARLAMANPTQYTDAQTFAAIREVINQGPNIRVAIPGANPRGDFTFLRSLSNVNKFSETPSFNPTSLLKTNAFLSGLHDPYEVSIVGVNPKYNKLLTGTESEIIEIMLSQENMVPKYTDGITLIGKLDSNDVLKPTPQIAELLGRDKVIDKGEYIALKGLSLDDVSEIIYVTPGLGGTVVNIEYGPYSSEFDALSLRGKSLYHWARSYEDFVELYGKPIPGSRGASFFNELETILEEFRAEKASYWKNSQITKALEAVHKQKLDAIEIKLIYLYDSFMEDGSAIKKSIPVVPKIITEPAIQEIALSSIIIEKDASGQKFVSTPKGKMPLQEMGKASWAMWGLSTAVLTYEACTVDNYDKITEYERWRATNGLVTNGLFLFTPYALIPVGFQFLIDGAEYLDKISKENEMQIENQKVVSFSKELKWKELYERAVSTGELYKLPGNALELKLVDSEGAIRLLYALAADNEFQNNMRVCTPRDYKVPPVQLYLKRSTKGDISSKTDTLFRPKELDVLKIGSAIGDKTHVMNSENGIGEIKLVAEIGFDDKFGGALEAAARRKQDLEAWIEAFYDENDKDMAKPGIDYDFSGPSTSTPNIHWTSRFDADGNNLYYPNGTSKDIYLGIITIKASERDPNSGMVNKIGNFKGEIEIKVNPSFWTKKYAKFRVVQTWSDKRIIQNMNAETFYGPNGETYYEIYNEGENATIKIKTMEQPLVEVYAVDPRGKVPNDKINIITKNDKIWSGPGYGEEKGDYIARKIAAKVVTEDKPYLSNLAYVEKKEIMIPLDPNYFKNSYGQATYGLSSLTTSGLGDWELQDFIRPIDDKWNDKYKIITIPAKQMTSLKSSEKDIDRSVNLIARSSIHDKERIDIFLPTSNTPGDYNVFPGNIRFEVEKW